MKNKKTDRYESVCFKWKILSEIGGDALGDPRRESVLFR